MSENIYCPEGLIEALHSGYSGQDKPQINRLEMEVGEPRESLVAKEQGGEVSFSISLSSSQLQELSVFYRDTCVYGTLHFYLPIDTGGGVTSHRVKFVDAPRWRTNGLAFSVTIKLKYSQPQYSWSN